MIVSRESVACGAGTPGSAVCCAIAPRTSTRRGQRGPAAQRRRTGRLGGADLGQEAEGNQGAGDSAQVNGPAADHLADESTPRALQDEVLGSERIDERILTCLLI